MVDGVSIIIIWFGDGERERDRSEDGLVSN